MAVAQKVQIAFGQAEPGHLVGTAELVVAMGNAPEGSIPPDYEALFRWAAIKTLCAMNRDQTPEDLAKERGWKLAPDDHVLKAGGPLHEAYVTTARTLRRTAIAATRSDPETDPRRITAKICHMIAGSALRGADELAKDPDAARREIAVDARRSSEQFRRHAYELGYSLEPDAEL